MDYESTALTAELRALWAFADSHLLLSADFAEASRVRTNLHIISDDCKRIKAGSAFFHENEESEATATQEQLQKYTCL